MADLNDLIFKYETGSLRSFQKVMIVLKKLQMGHYLKQIESGHQNETMEFDVAPFRRNIYFVKDNMNLEMHPDHIKVNLQKRIVKTKDNEDKFHREYDPYYVETSYHTVQLDAATEILLNERDGTKIEDKVLTRKFERLLNNIKDFEENHQILALFQPYVSIPRGGRNTNMSELNIPIGFDTFSRTISPLTELFKEEYKHPTDSSTNRFYNMIESILTHPKRLSENIKFKDFSLKVSGKIIVLKYGLFTLTRLNDTNFKQRFTYSIEVKLFIKILEYLGCIDGLEMATQKSVISNY